MTYTFNLHKILKYIKHNPLFLVGSKSVYWNNSIGNNLFNNMLHSFIVIYSKNLPLLFSARYRKGRQIDSSNYNLSTCWKHMSDIEIFAFLNFKPITTFGLRGNVSSFWTSQIPLLTSLCAILALIPRLPNVTRIVAISTQSRDLSFAPGCL